MRAWLKDLLTDANGDADETVLYAFLGIMTFVWMQVYDVIYLKHAFNPQGFGVGMGAILAGVFAGYGAKSKLERKP